ncbi:hypothetical protein TNCV_799071 [Trichonephila clavipes]|nr:hypothetical protein TNCV_799071 [Trichonephila clavipes]
MADKDILEFVQSSKNIIDTDSDDESEKNNAAPVPTSSEMRITMKSMRSSSHEHSNGEMNSKMDNIKQLDAKKDNAKKIIRLFTNNSINILFLKRLENSALNFLVLVIFWFH